ncbi:MAG TPA: hypothetical protein VEJ36_01270 [Nitrososphaerales archaeon]|nr:hypothetical protein [Nitrososphaerales archaeon]
MESNPGFTELMEKRKEADDVYNYSYALRNSLKRLDESEILSEGDKDIIREFLEHLRAKRVSTGRLAKYGFTIRRLTEHLGVDESGISEPIAQCFFCYSWSQRLGQRTCLGILRHPRACLERVPRWRPNAYADERGKLNMSKALLRT